MYVCTAVHHRHMNGSNSTTARGSRARTARAVPRARARARAVAHASSLRGGGVYWVLISEYAPRAIRYVYGGGGVHMMPSPGTVVRSWLYRARLAAYALAEDHRS
jgi:hypothetical protein